jgi:hypothetical protein
MLRAKEVGDLLIGSIVGEQRSQQGLLGLQVDRRVAEVRGFLLKRR